MRHFLAALALGSMSTTLVAAPEAYKPYRDGFLLDQVPAEAEDTGPGRFEIVREGRLGTIDLEATTPLIRDYTTGRSYCGQNVLTDKVIKPDMFSFACMVDANTVYHVAKFGRTHRLGADNVVDTIELTVIYPTEQRSYWDPLARHMGQALQFADQTEGKTDG